jgi:hypothetical protein
MHTQLGLDACRNNHMPSDTAKASWAKRWLTIATARSIRSVGLVLLEVLILAAIGLWTLIGLFRHAAKTGWTLSGLLTMLHEQWRGAMILGVFLFYRTLREGLDQVRFKNVKTPLGELEFHADKLEPVEENQT